MNLPSYPMIYILAYAAALSLTACGRDQGQSSAQVLPSPHAIEITANSVPLNPQDADEIRIGSLIYRGGLKLSSPNKNFGGLSGILVSADGKRFVAVSDKGFWVTGDLAYTQGNLTDVKNVELAPLLDPSGTPVMGKLMADAESISGSLDQDLKSSGPLRVSFERQHRVWSYPFARDGFDARATATSMPDDLTTAELNGGLESILQLPTEPSSMLAITEATLNADGDLKGWIVEGTKTRAIALKQNGPFSPTDLGLLPGGDILVLERRFSPLAGVGMGLRRIAAASLNSGDTLDGPQIVHLGTPYNVDNMEGLSIRTDQDGRTLLYIVSDDNFNPLQRTLLMMFELVE